MTEVTTAQHAIFTATLSAPSGKPVSFRYTTGNLTATSGSDYANTSATVTIPVEDPSVTFGVQIYTDLMHEPTENFFVNLSQSTNVSFTDSQGKATIIDNDPIPTFTITAGSVTEPNSGFVNRSVTIRLSSPTYLAVTGSVDSLDGTAIAGQDYTAFTSTFSFTPETTQLTSQVRILGDTIGEATEQFTTKASNIANAVAEASVATVTILDNDRVPDTFFDFDGDRKADQAVFRPAEGVWYLLQSRDSAVGYGFGLAGDQLAAADYDGDGKADPAIYREGVWWVLNSNGTGHNAIQWGITSDIPVAADYDGDGTADRSVYRDGTWWILFSSGAGYTTINWGIAGDKPVPADYDGDGKADFAVYRNGEWWILFANGNGYNMVQLGMAGDKPVPADYDGNGSADLAVYREGEWQILNGMGQTSTTQWGIPGDEPVPADYDGDGKTDISIYRNGEWWTLYSNGYTNNTWGIPGDVPVPRR